MSVITDISLNIAEQNLVPDFIMRCGIRHFLLERLKRLEPDNCERRNEITTAFVQSMRKGPIAPVSEKANEWHYEVCECTRTPS